MVDRIKALCKEQGTSVTKLEVLLDFGNGSIGKWKNAKSAPPIDKLQKVADALGVTVDYLLTGKTQKEPAPLSENEPVDYDKWLSSLSQDELLKVIAKATQALQERNK